MVSHKISSLNIYLLALVQLVCLFCCLVIQLSVWRSWIRCNANLIQNTQIQIFHKMSQSIWIFRNITIIPILDKLKILDIIEVVIGYECMPKFGKLLFYNINTDLITNLSGLISQVGMAVVLFILSKMYLWLCFKNKYHRIRACIQNYKSRIFHNRLLLWYINLMH
ncbi:unnamed protein product [Paramecium octaurelia]|uniref:Uncharacterized protein n=1 Tax=Paramecium octaurelia TaxID=43137 RepID=A0A8S1XUU3_PAROT|nr:unnamed protein product [Paramecium octaurelia]